MATEPDFFVKQGDFQALAAGRPMLYYRELAKARADWERGWRDLFACSFPASVDAIDAALGFDPEAEGDEDVDADDVDVDVDDGDGDGDEADGPEAG